MLKILKSKDIKLWFFIISIIGVFVKTSSLLFDYDYAYQVKLGGEIVRNFNFNAIDKVLWGTTGLGEYYDHEWLTNVLFYLFSQIPYGVLITKIFIEIIFALVFYRYLKFFLTEDYNFTTYLGIFICNLVVCIMSINIKPYVLSLSYMMIEIILLYKYKENRDKLYKFIGLSSLIVIVWNNFHSGSIIMYFAVAGLFWLTELRDKDTIIIGVVNIFSLLINPFGYKLILFDFKHFSDSSMKSIFLDWHSLDAKTMMGLVLLSILILLIYNTIKSGTKDKFSLLFLIFNIYLLTSSVRHSIFLLCLVPIIMRKSNIKDIIDLDYRLFKWGSIILSILIIVTVGIALTDRGMCEGKQDLDNELVQVLHKTNDKDDSEGLFNDISISVIPLDIKGFICTAYPSNKERWNDAYFLTLNGSEFYFENIIDKYKLKKFLIEKYDDTYIPYGKRPSNLFTYLYNNDKYELVYDNDEYSYFIEKGMK